MGDPLVFAFHCCNCDETIILSTEPHFCPHCGHNIDQHGEGDDSGCELWAAEAELPALGNLTGDHERFTDMKEIELLQARIRGRAEGKLELLRFWESTV